jgi:hypothetical protein
MMVAAHSSNLAGTAAAGRRNALIARMNERGIGKEATAPNVPVALRAGSLVSLLGQLGVADSPMRSTGGCIRWNAQNPSSEDGRMRSLNMPPTASTQLT